MSPHDYVGIPTRIAARYRTYIGSVNRFPPFMMRMISHILQNTSWVTNRSHAATHLLPDARKRAERVGRPKTNEQGGVHTHHINGCPGPE